MRQIYDDLWETAAFRVPNGPATHAYLWTPPSAPNVLFYNLGSDDEIDALADLGGVAHQYLSHRDEISPMLTVIAERFDTILHSSAAERHLVAEVRTPDEVFDTRHVDARGVEVIATPGHTPGSACFLVDGAAGHYLFTGDTILRRDDGTWFAGYIPGYSDLDDLLATLDLLADLEPDIVVSSAFTGTAGAHQLDRPWAQCVAEASALLTAEHVSGRTSRSVR
ncbi:MAG: MBL fold metallo-hydrolase [Acidimicrobiaceae bacterium]|nr:MBL fold metallo-hydrolase [Acidimicrobiaceae bacterium]